MWLFRLIYSIFIFAVFIFFRNTLDIDIYYAITYAIGIVLAINLVETLIVDLKSMKVASGFVGGLLFLLIAFVVMTALEAFVNEAFKMAFYFVFAYLGIFIGYKNNNLVETLINKMYKKQSKSKVVEIPKVLDTSTLIDGRIADIVETDLIEGKLVIPMFVLKELQNIADSHDHLRRQKGRRGLNILKRLQEQKHIPTEVSNEDFPDLGSVDEKLVALAKKLEGKIITTDFNLLKVAEIQNVKVLNINSLALALRQTVLPGEELTITILKEGKEHSQGVGYLEDGTMVVVEHGKNHIGEQVNVEVTSLLQTDSGRIIFTKMK
jgi:uncharacterized protein YacL